MGTTFSRMDYKRGARTSSPYDRFLNDLVYGFLSGYIPVILQFHSALGYSPPYKCPTIPSSPQHYFIDPIYFAIILWRLFQFLVLEPGNFYLTPI